tara:strand:- start:272 stop:562 length:291 start_codon:yes stop_codon:yes gene_type:complete
MNSLSNSYKFIGIGMLLISTQYFSNHAESYPLIRKICMANINKEIKDAGIDKPQELLLDTCTCFAEKLRAGQSIDSAKEICKSKMQKKIQISDKIK